jgi:hypothetical protein
MKKALLTETLSVQRIVILMSNSVKHLKKQEK